MSSNPPLSVQSSTLPPAQPAYVFRGHSAQIHAVHFLERNLRLISGDADGWVVLWSVTVKRCVAVWKPHNASILGLGSWRDDRIITHGRDSKLYIWKSPDAQLNSTFSTTLPIDDAVLETKQPWLLHSLDVNTLNFCSFASSQDLSLEHQSSLEDGPRLLIATPGIQDGYINVTGLPHEDRVATIPTPKDTHTGMVMALALHSTKTDVTVLAGYESGHLAVWQKAGKFWQTIYVNKAHSQPVLSLGVSYPLNCVFSSSADAIITRHSLPGGDMETRAIQTKHAGQQSLAVRSDGKIFGTAGWDGRMRVYSTKGMTELAVLKWHKEGCYALAFAQVNEADIEHQGTLQSEQTVSKRDLPVSEQRVEKARATHWLAAGSKDGKVSLWDIY